MFYSTRSKVIASFLGVTFLLGAVFLFIGGQLVYKSVLNEATNRVKFDLNAAREIYRTEINRVELSLNLATLGTGFRSALKNHDRVELANRLRRMAQLAGLDFAGISNEAGEVLCRMGPSQFPDVISQPENLLVNLVLKKGVPVSGTVILDREFLAAENPELAERSRIESLHTVRSIPRIEKEETSGMALGAAIPVFNDDRLLGFFYGGVLLNRSSGIVDRVRDTVFQQEVYKERSIGTATIFFNDLRISTNVLNADKKRAIGTRVSGEVKERVLDKGEQWIDRAFVVSDWYITAYEPIEDIFGDRVGMLYVGVLEAKYADIRRKALSVLVLITVAGMVLALGLGYVLADKIMRPVHRLIKASQEVVEGSLTPDLGPVSKDEIGVLQTTFKDMVEAMGRRRAAAENRLLQSEKQASIGRLAAGVAHEINNPLTGVLTFTRLLQQRKDFTEDVRSDLHKIADSTKRVQKIVRGLLDFSRQTKLDRKPTEVNKIVGSTVSLMENQALLKGVGMKFHPGENLPMTTLDQNQFESVLLNIIINALDATEPGGNITVSTGIGFSASSSGKKGVDISISDTGSGIPPEDLDKLFEPFFTTKEVGKGTGLGLAVSYGIVHRHNGTIRVESAVGRGSTFTIWFPLEEQSE